MSDSTDTINFDDLSVVAPLSTDSVLCGRGRIAFESFVELIQSTIYPEVTDYTSTSITIASVAAGTTYKYGTLSSLTLTAVENSIREAQIFFSSGSTATTFTYPDSLDVIGNATLLPSTSYAIAICNNIMAIAPLNSSVLSSITLQAYNATGTVLSGETVKITGTIDGTKKTISYD